jgi:hypothetical protein
VPNDPFLTFSISGGAIRGQFDNDNNDFLVTCTDVGKQAVITFNRTHNDGTTTEYTGLVMPVPARQIVRIRGRFERTTTAAAAALTGDWETEKPT